MVLSKAKKRSAFQPGSLVIVKRNSIRGKIIDTLGSKKWKVELTLDGQTTVAAYTSQQLRHPKDQELQDDTFNSSSSSSNDVQAATTTSDEQTRVAATTSDEQTGVETGVLASDQAHPHRTRVAIGQPRVDAEVMTVLREDSDSSFIAIHPGDDDDSVNSLLQQDSSSDSSNGDIPVPPPALDTDLFSSDSDDGNDAPLDESNNEEEEDPDDDISEDLPSRNTVTGGDDGTEADISGATFAAQLEPEDDKYRRKQEFYKLDKQKLIDDKWTVKKKPSKQTKLAVGATVQERFGVKRSGFIVDNGNEELTWMVRFERTEKDEQLPSARLKLVHNNSEYVWTIVKDSSPEQNKAVTEYRDTGLTGIHFGEEFSDTSASNEDYGYPYLRLLQTLWPGKFKQVNYLSRTSEGKVSLILLTNKRFFTYVGDWVDQLRNLNHYIETRYNKNHSPMSVVSRHEWWQFIGIMIGAGPIGKGGITLWEKAESRKDRTFSPSLDLSKTVSRHRYECLRHCFPFAFYDWENADADPWHPVGLLVKGFNENRNENFAASSTQTHDESMSAFRPRTTPTSLLPNISFILRKPEPLGTEFKVQ
jgi:hypothetical protein